MDYKEKYGAWAGNPEGHKPDLTRCCEIVHESGRGMLSYQCNRKRGHGPDKAYCKQHDPAAVKARQEAATARYNEQYNKDCYRWNAKTFYAALKQIADGHNDPRALATEVLRKFHEGER